MNQIVILKHKNTDTALLELSEGNYSVLKIKNYNQDHMPYLREMSLKEINLWWANRAIPGTRKELSKILKKYGCDNSLQYMTKNLGLSLSDCYWICPVGVNLTCEDVNLYKNTKQIKFKDNLGNIFSNNPNSSLNGTMDKEAVFEDGKWVLKKYGETQYGEQCINECFANLINKKQGFEQYLNYKLQFDKNRCISCTCEFFTNENVEFVTAYDFTSFEKQKSSKSNYEQYINLCANAGLDAEEVRKFMDYQTLLDFVISNTDRHYQNFGILRDPDTLKLVSVAPIFDCGNSMFYKNPFKMSAYEMLSTEITSMAKYEEKMLEYVKYKNIFDIEKLPTKEEVEKFYIENKIGENIAENISENFQRKVEMLYHFQKGEKITRYTVKNWDNGK